MIEVFKILQNIYDADVSGGILQLSKVQRQEDVHTSIARNHPVWMYKVTVFLSMEVVKRWNSLPKKVIMSPSVKVFEARLEVVSGRMNQRNSTAKKNSDCAIITTW